ncbi:formate dehydrogenase subunit delta [Methylocapsa palsarum]|uniref:Formate dehydrogenase subunit delta n=1 Tax=Methylocapsa palsarum TaxID=1612308 RepID=A0A1I3W8X5_9HYPH|nr:formate dehydrogenase subunit delta [Methylocapsa palsarum]SFK03935.1 formate dehydrogenase subunit delta [Methylocapsa palsarum]
MTPDKQISKLVYMANQIGHFFASQTGDAKVDGVADHIAKFWDPRMREKIISHVRQGGEGVDALVKEAVMKLDDKTATPAI